MSTTPKRHTGNQPRAVKKAAKYHLKREEGEWAVELQYVLNSSERALLTTREHPDLIEMVNRTKEAVNGSPGGAFYIDEYARVVIPSTTGDYFVAGTYDELLEFDFDGDIVSSRPPDGIAPGDEWDGPHVGIPYTLTATGDDVRYEAQFGNIVEKRTLSEAAGPDAAARLARRLAAHKKNGGKIYVNECREFFAPIQGDDGWHFIYLGPLGADEWFPRPT